MRISLPQLEVGEEEGFTKAKDIFGLKDLGDGMTNLVLSFEDSLVIALDGQWGAGKTTFLKMWAGELRKQGCPTIYFDAFENDYVEDAFAALAREVSALIESKESTGMAIGKSFKDKAIGLGKLIGLVGARVGVKIAVRATTAGLASDKDVASVIEEVTDASGDVAERYMEEILSQPNKQKQTVQAFREVLAGLPFLLSPVEEGKKQMPLIFIIDELDRCKPIFALQVLERIKHFLTVPNVHFVLGVHLAQLGNSVRVAYGSEIDATSYLQKFINLTVTHVDTREYQHNTRITKFTDHLVKSLDFKPKDDQMLEIVTNFVQRVATHRNMSLRTIERIYSHIAVCLAFTGENQYRPGPLIAGLCVLKVIAPEQYAKAKTGKLRYEEIAPLFGFEATGSPDVERENQWEQQWWQYCLQDNLPEGFPDFRESQTRYGLPRDRKKLLPVIANLVVDRLLPQTR